MRTLNVILGLSLAVTTSAWSSHQLQNRSPLKVAPSVEKFDPLNLEKNENKIVTSAPQQQQNFNAVVASALALGTTTVPTAASAATAFTPNAIPAAAAAYGHYLALVGIVACIMTERLTIKPNMTEQEEDVVALADTGLGVWGLLIAYTGYLRVAEYEKGFAFYSHEPVFWLKIAFVGVFGAASFFNTYIVIKRAVARRSGDFTPMGEKLAKRMVQICNAELVALATIPATATFMARGVGYSQDFPWPVEAALAAAVFLGLSFKYVKEAVEFEDGPLAIGDGEKDMPSP